jgi:glucosamine-6-phosphate deaminase
VRVPRLRIAVTDDYQELSRVGADVVAETIAAAPRARVVIATGATPMGLYRELAGRSDAGTLDATGITVFQLDEYAGIAPDDRRSLLAWAVRSFVEPLRIPLGSVVPVPADGDPVACAGYDREAARSGGYDLAILGIGTNGHVGFNEPPSDASAPTRMVELSPQSIRSNAAYWGGPEHVPRRAITIGLAGLLRSRTILLVASGSAKRDIVRRAVLGPVTPEVPASHLRTAADLRVLVDRAAWDGPVLER